MGFLSEIVRETRLSIENPAYGRPLPDRGPQHRPSFRASVERDRDRGSLVVEYKRVSPGQVDPVLPVRSVREFLAATVAADVSAYSCLATIPRFDGSPSDVAEVARATGRPVLFKDFVVDRRQVEVAARTGASAILLIARLDDEGHLSEPLASLAEAAHRMGLEVLLEFHARAELSRAANVSADVYGVNTRDLDTLTIDRRTAARTIREARDRGLSPLLGLSGVESPRDALRFWNEEVDGILVGGAVARASDPAKFLASLHRAPGGRRR